MVAIFESVDDLVAIIVDDEGDKVEEEKEAVVEVKAEEELVVEAFVAVESSGDGFSGRLSWYNVAESSNERLAFALSSCQHSTHGSIDEVETFELELLLTGSEQKSNCKH